MCLLACGGPEPALREREPAPRVEIAPEPFPVVESEETDAVPVARLRLEDERALDEGLRAAIARGHLPGAVVLLGDAHGTVFRRAYGARSVVPERTPMREDTIFDLASVTKVFTAVLVLQAAENDELELDAPVDRALPELAGHGITPRDLLTHHAGLRPVTPLSDYEGERDDAIRQALSNAWEGPRGRYRYSDLSFLALGAMLERVTGIGLEVLLQRRIAEPLGLRATRYAPPASWRPRIAPTEFAANRGDPPPMIHGEANDPRAWRLGGVAGHAGIFGSADDLARFARGLLEPGPLLSAASLRALRTERGGRGLGVDRSPRRGEAWSPEAFGHGGYTGTWLWVDPACGTSAAALRFRATSTPGTALPRCYAIVLSHRVHPDGAGEVAPLRSAVGRLAPAMVARARRSPQANVRLGVDVLRAEGFARLRGKRVALVTNDAGRARDGAATWELLRDAEGVSLVRLFAPEHGLAADREGHIGDDELDGIEVRSLFGPRTEGGSRRPAPDALVGLDAVVIDLQDVGARFYTYASTTVAVLEAAAEAGVAVWILDRPNPIAGGGARDTAGVSGPVTDDDVRSFVNYHPLPVTHGLSLGELARFMVDARGIEAELEVVRMQGWRRDMIWADTGLRWTPPSPNLRSPDAVLLYPGVALLESTNVSVGRGTERPFEQVGAPWMDPERILAELGDVPGVAIAPTSFQPSARPHRRARCAGLAFTLTDRRAFDPVRLGVALVRALARVHPEAWETERLVRMVGDAALVEGAATSDLDGLMALDAEGRAAFERAAAPHRLYR